MSGEHRANPACVGRSIPHQSARAHVTGSSRFVDDLPHLSGELQVAFLPAPVARGRIRSLDVSAGRESPGVVGVYAAADIPGDRLWGPVVADEPFLPADEIAYRGQPLLVIAAESRSAARAALRKVHMVIDPEPPVIGIDAAIAASEYLGPVRRIARGDFRSAFEAAPLHHAGTLRLDGQEHFYLETQAAIAWRETEGLHIRSSTQNPTEVQAAVARMLGLTRNQVVCECHYVGGGFGGKETGCVLPACMAALVVQQTGRPARVIYRRTEDLHSTGKRHPFRCDYRIGFDETGRILAFGLELWADGGAFTDLSPAVVDRAVLHAENAYFIPDIEIRGALLRTNRAPSTAMRGFGAPQAVAAIEKAIEEVAQRLRRDPLEIRSSNLYGRAGEETEVTPYGQTLRGNQLPEILPRLARTARYRERRAEIELHNRHRAPPLRGIALTPVKFGISFTQPHLNQAGALVHVLTDGSVQVSTGAIEMGQGVNTKLQQIAADALGIGTDAIRILSTSTERIHNSSPSAASVSADLNGAAVVDACARIRSRLEHIATEKLALRLGCAPGQLVFADGRVFAASHPHEQLRFSELCDLAWRARIDLGARGFFATPGLDFSWSGACGRGEPFHYFTTGAAVAEVEIDRFTGAVYVPRADLLLDIGRRINPGIDDGQVIGGFVQALGWCTNELLVYDDDGKLLTDSGATYKIPGVSDVPAQLEIGYVESQNSLGIAGSKAVGEPPFLLGISVWAAIRHALSCVEPGALPELALPATAERVLRALTELSEARYRRPQSESIIPPAG